MNRRKLLTALAVAGLAAMDAAGAADTYPARPIQGGRLDLAPPKRCAKASVDSHERNGLRATVG